MRYASSMIPQIDLTFKDLEQVLMRCLADVFTQMMQEMLEALDEAIFKRVDPKRYESRGKLSRTLETLFGTVTFQRRSYVDRRDGTRTFLLDDALGITRHARMSDGLAELAAAMSCRHSYRLVADELEELLGERLLSHETVRQLTHRAASRLDAYERQRMAEPRGERKVPILFVEVDGVWTHLQREKRDGCEVKMGVSHEGWVRRHRNDYSLVNKRYWASIEGGDVFWEEFSRKLHGLYDITEETMVVINGDGAPWIRRGVDYFPKAIYIYDRFHLERDLSRVLSHDRGRRERCKFFVQAGDIEGLLLELEEAVREAPDSKTRGRVRRMHRRVGENQDAIGDYREKLASLGYETEGIRNMGAAESNVDKFAKRLKKNGYSWSLWGLRAMTIALVEMFEGTMEFGMRQGSEAKELLSMERVMRGARIAVKRVVEEALPVIRGRIPALEGPHQSRPYVRALRDIASEQALA